MKNCKRFKILKALLAKTGLNFGNISVEYGLRNIRLVYRKTNKKQKTENINSLTNNCLERYNRRLGSKFQNVHPNIFWFIAAIKEEEHYFSKLTTGIRSGNIPYSVEFEYQLNFFSNLGLFCDLIPHFENDINIFIVQFSKTFL
ncbi:hypothetical protein HZS_638 [Henneguya salminicola]|nr:hypothetical protein HZS_638 [Henneguya salminicola]